MKHARIAWAGAVHEAVESNGELLLTRSPWASPRAAREQQLAIGFNGLMHSASPSNACVFHAVAPTK